MDYTLRYLPIAKQDLADAINFILNEYHNPIATENTLDKIEQAIMQCLEIRRIQPASRNEELFLYQIMLQLLIEEAKSRKVTEISLDATEKGRPLYESMGFSSNDSAMTMKL